MVAVTVTVVAAVALLAVAVGVVYAGARVPAEFSLEPAVVLDRTGAELGTIEPQAGRRAISIEEMPEHLRDAVLAAEDDGFYRHGGVSVPAVLRAAVVNTISGEITQGGSTVTQQYVKVVTADTERTAARKFREAVLAMKIERTLGKDEILERYLNNAYFGRGAYGVEAAAQVFYGKPAADLDPAESALIAGLLPAPTHYDPALNPGRAAQRYTYVVDRLDSVGWANASDFPSRPPQTIERRPLEVGEAPYFLDTVRGELAEILEGEEAIFAGGLTVTSTLNLGVQRAAEAAERDVLREVEGARGAIVAVDPATGEVRALVGGRGHATEPLNLATRAMRQPGSTAKVFGLQAWLEDGRSPETVVPAPASWARPGCVGDARACTVGNYGGQGYGSMTVRQAMWRSVNTVYAQLNHELGNEPVVRAAETAGIPAGRLDPTVETVLGAQEVTPWEMADAFNTYATGGIRRPAHTVVRIERDGEVIWEADHRDERVMSEGDAWVMTDVLRGVMTSGTGTAADIGRPAAGKTGTTSRHADAWFVGYTPHLTASVWLGRPEGNTAMPGNPSGGGFPARAWAQFVGAALEPVAPVDFPEPPETSPGEAFGGATPETDQRDAPAPAPQPQPTSEPAVEPDEPADEPADEPIAPPPPPAPQPPPPIDDPGDAGGDGNGDSVPSLPPPSDDTNSGGSAGGTGYGDGTTSNAGPDG